MSTEMQTKVQASPAQNFTPIQTGLLQKKSALCNTPWLVKDSGRDKEKLTLQRSLVDQPETTTVPPIVHEVLESPWKPLDPETRVFMESRFGHDFSRVRVHTGAKADESARALNALAYTVGRNVAFSTGQYTPQTPTGQLLLAHELTHVIQQGNSDTTTPTRLGAETDHHEREASAASIKVLTDPAERSASVVTGGVEPGTVQRGWPVLVLVATGAGILGGIYALWAYNCLSPLETPLYMATFGSADSSGTGGFRLWYYNQTRNPVPSNAWDAFGHCWAACASTRRCGAITAAIAGKGREFYREYIDSRPHDSYEQDTNNQTLGRGFGNQRSNCTISCRTAALPGGAMDLSAPQVDLWTPARGTYTPP